MVVIKLMNGVEIEASARFLWGMKQARGHLAGLLWRGPEGDPFIGIQAKLDLTSSSGGLHGGRCL